MGMRVFAFLSGKPAAPRVKHYVGPPPQLTGGNDVRQELGPATFLVVDERPDGVFLYRFGAAGECVGDTWHMSVDDAKHQAAYEFEGLIGGWDEVPEGTEDVVAFCLARR
jgi:hypothetical protein